jgi:hypothetical protein
MCTFPWLGLYHLYLRRYLYPGWPTPRRRIKGEDIRVLEGRKGLSHVEGVTLYLSSRERGIPCGEKREREREEGGEARGAIFGLGGFLILRLCTRYLLL